MPGLLLPVTEGGCAYGRGATAGGTSKGAGVEGGATADGAAGGGGTVGGATGGGGTAGGGATAHAMTVLSIPGHRSSHSRRVPIGGRPLTVMLYS
jgi:hypothetical protein